MTLRSFDKFIIQNGPQIEQADRYIAYLTMLMPGQAPTLEVACEAFASSTRLLQIYKDQVLASLVSSSKKTLNSRYLDAEFATHKRYRTLAYMLSVVKSTEVFAEMTATHLNGRKGKWRAIIGIETLKASIRLVMLYMSRRALPSNIPIHELEVDQDDLLAILEASSKDTNHSFRKFNIENETRKGLPTVTVDLFRPPIQLIRKLNAQLAFSEILMIIRPVVYSLLLYKYRRNRKAWTPWILGVGIELLAKEIANESISQGGRMATGLEKELYSSRRRDLIWWLLRGAVYENYTRGFMTEVTSKVSKIPLFGVFGKLLEDGLEFFDENYFASATL